jgi:Scaffold domain
LAADELTLTNSIATFVRHASTGRIAFSRVSSSIYFDLKPPDLQQVLEKIASSHDIAATSDSFNPPKGCACPCQKNRGRECSYPRARTKTEAVRAKLLARGML